MTLTMRVVRTAARHRHLPHRHHRVTPTVRHQNLIVKNRNHVGKRRRGSCKKAK